MLARRLRVPYSIGLVVAGLWRGANVFYTRVFFSSSLRLIARSLTKF
jgi:hypothetical protein